MKPVPQDRAWIAVVGPSEADGRTMTRHANVLEVVRSPIAVTSATTRRIIHANPAFQRLTGYSAPELLGLPISVAIPGGEGAVDALWIETRRQLDERGEARFEVPRLRADGTALWVRIDVTRFEDPELGELWVLAFDDVTARRCAEEELAARMQRTIDALESSEHKYGLLWRSGMVGVVVSDFGGRMLEANDACLAIFGFDREDLLAGKMDWAQLSMPEHRRAGDRAVEQLGQRGYADPFEIVMHRKDGSTVPVLVAVGALDQTTGFAVVTDLSAIKGTQEALRRTEEQLLQAQKMDAIGRLAGGVAHDFNNLLSVISSYSDLLRADLPDTSPMRADLDEIFNAAERAGELTRQLLLFSRQQVATPGVVSPNQLIAGLDRMLGRLIGEDIELRTLPGAGVGDIRADGAQLEQVILNLVVNARDAMPRGGRLTVQTSEVTFTDADRSEHVDVTAGTYVMIAVSDTGSGMDRGTIARIFEPFFTTKGPGKGSGLGLSIVFGIVQKSDGHIWVYSEPDRGTTFKLLFPKVSEHAVRACLPPPAPELAAHETILVVEDEEQVRRVAISVLRRRGYHVLEAATPNAAIELVGAHPAKIDLLLTDVVMPQLNGPELAAQLCLLRPDMAVLYMSGFTDNGAVLQDVLSGTSAFLQKPLTPDRLCRKVRDVLDARSSERPAR